MQYELNSSLERIVVNGFSFPLGWAPPKPQPPLEGFTITFHAGDDETPESFQFLIVVSHERLKAVIDRLFGMLPDEVYPILEAGSRDAYRQVDVLISDDPISFVTFYSAWRYFEPVLLEDGAIAAGAMSDNPYIEILVDEYKGVSISVTEDRREIIENVLDDLGLSEVPEHWTDDAIESGLRSVIDSTPGRLSIDDVIMNLQRAWRLELDVDLDGNADELGRELGVTIWHVVALAVSEQTEGQYAYVEMWMSADSLGQVEELAAEVFEGVSDWRFEMMVAQDRVPFDDRPEALIDIEPGSNEIGVWSVEVFPID
ncbi:MAG: hypothetical protein ACF8PN_13550 [Phycisphaerales bacterium]